MFRKSLDRGEAGDNLGALVRGLKREDVRRGQVAVRPGTFKQHTKFKAQIYVLAEDEGGRSTPFKTKYKPQFFFNTADVTGTVTLPDEHPIAMPGDSAKIEIQLIYPVMMYVGMQFSFREGGKTVGKGVVGEVIE